MSYNLHIEENSIVIIKKSSSKQKCLKISYQFKIEQVEAKHLQLHSNNCSKPYHAILGIKVIKNIPLLIAVKQHQPICVYQGAQVYEIKQIDWIPLMTNSLNNNSLESSDIEQQLNNISKIFEQGLHYYSDSYSLWKPFLLNHLPNTQQQLSYYQQFVWNSTIIKLDIQSQYMSTLFSESKQSKQQYNTQLQTFSKWCTPIIQGYVNFFETILPDNNKLQYLLVSRRSYKKAGTRFFSRGVDDCGNVANYTETQCIVQYNDLVMSSVQVRGSVPVFFQQIGMEGINIQLNIQRTRQMTKKPFVSHFASILQRYDRCLCINLLSRNKKSQQKLSNFYQQMINLTTISKGFLSSNVSYQFFDFHQQCKNNQFHNSQKLINKIISQIHMYGFNCYNLSSRKLIKRQTGIFRTNCLDCLDRTNYVQSRIALTIMKQMLVEFASVGVRKHVIQLGLLKHVDVEVNSQLLNCFNLLWAENGDAVSLHYTGIGSTHTDITKVGRRTLFGTVNHKMRSLMRFYTQFTDVKKHQTINTFLGNKSILNWSGGQNNIERKTKEQNVLVMSWQFTDPQRALTQFEKNPYHSKTYQHLLTLLKQSLNNKHSIIVLFLFVPNQKINWQSGINFDLKNFLNPFKSPYTEIINKWSDFITTELESGTHKYVLIDANSDPSCKMLIFCHRSQIDSISNIKKDQITSSLKTREVVLLTKFKFHQSPLVFQGFNVKNMSSFGDFVQKVSQKGFQQNILGRSKSTSVNEQSYKLILGNVGSQSALSQEEYQQLEYQLVQEKKKLHGKSPNKPILSSIQAARLINVGCEHDQLKKFLESTQLITKQKVKVLANYNQPPLQFIPSNNRILFWNEEEKIVRVKSYAEIMQDSYQNQTHQRQLLGRQSIVMGKQKGILMCYPTLKQDVQKQAESCVYLQLSYEIDEILV